MCTCARSTVGSASADAVTSAFDVRRSALDIRRSPFGTRMPDVERWMFGLLPSCLAPPPDPFRHEKDPERTRFGRGFLSTSCLDLSTTPARPTPSEKPRPARNSFSAPTARNAPPHAVIRARSRHSAPTKRSHPCNARPHTFQPPRFRNYQTNPSPPSVFLGGPLDGAEYETNPRHRLCRPQPARTRYKEPVDALLPQHLIFHERPPLLLRIRPRLRRPGGRAHVPL